MNKKAELLTKWTGIKVVDTKKCRYCNDDFSIYDFEKKFLNKHGFMDTTQCPTCTFRMLYSFFNDKHLYNRADSETGEKIISTYAPESDQFIIKAERYKEKILDDFGLDFWKEIGKNIFSDFQKLYEYFPKQSKLFYPGLENSEYSSHCAYTKNTYLSFWIFTDCENIFYSLSVMTGCRDIFDSYLVASYASNIYRSFLVTGGYNIFFSTSIFESSDILHCRDMENCQNCIFSCNQVNKKYLIFNKKYSKEEYEKIKSTIYDSLQNKEKREELLKTYEKFLEKNYIESGTFLNRTEKSTGDYIVDCNQVVNSLGIVLVDIGINTMGWWGNKKNEHIYNGIEFGTGTANCIGSCSFGFWVRNIFFSAFIVENCNNIYYCIDMENCEECMFSVGLKNKKYCILNKEYSKEEYLEKKKEIIESCKRNNTWGKYLWFNTSTYPYNDTLAYDYYGVEKIIYPDGSEKIINKNSRGIVTLKTTDFIADAILDFGGEKIRIKWRTGFKEVNIPEDTETILGNNLPRTQEAGKEVLEKAIVCEKTGRPFKILPYELKFLKRHNLPLPTKHHQIRLEKVIQERPYGEIHLWKSDVSWEPILNVYKNKPKWKICSHEEYKKIMYDG